MRNVRPSMKKNCLFLYGEDFEILMRTLFGEETETEYALEGSGVNLYCGEEDISDDDIIEELSKYFDVEVTSFHTDCYETVGVWVVYK